MTTKTTINPSTAKAILIDAFPNFKGYGQDNHWFYNDDNKFGLMSDGIGIEFCECETPQGFLFTGKVEILNPDYEDSDPEDDCDIEPWLTICKSDFCLLLTDAITSLKQAISAHAETVNNITRLVQN
jgi:hypothetical protein